MHTAQELAGRGRATENDSIGPGPPFVKRKGSPLQYRIGEIVGMMKMFVIV